MAHFTGEKFLFDMNDGDMRLQGSIIGEYLRTTIALVDFVFGMAA